jgi:hypothetical protein
VKPTQLLPLIALLLAVACDDDRQVQSKAPTAPVTASVVADSSPRAASTVCRSYNRELNAVQTLQAQSPGDAALQEKVSTLNAVISDACR